MAKKNNAKGRHVSGTFCPLPTSILNNEQLRTLSPAANKIFTMMLAQLRYEFGGTKNNGNISATLTQASKWGIKHPRTLKKALTELLKAGFIELTRQVSFSSTEKNRPNLYAVTFWAIDDCHPEVKQTVAPSRLWLKNQIQMAQNDDQYQPLKIVD